MTHPKILLYFFIFINTFNVQAQTSSSTIDSISFYFPKVVVTANRYEKNAFETNIPVNSIQEMATWQQGVANSGELLQQTAGVTFTSAGPWSQKLVIRGLAGSQVLTMIDGMRLDVLRSYGNHAPLIDVNQIDRVEVIRGPASILYGSNAIAGVVNYITKKPDIKASGSSINGNIGLQYHSVNQQQIENIKLAAHFRNWALLVGFNNRKAENVNTPQGELINTGFNGYTVDATIAHKPSKRHYFSLMSQINRLKDIGVPINKYAKSAKFLKYNRNLIKLSYEYRAQQNILANLKTNIYYQKGERNFDAFLYQIPKGNLFVNQTLNAHRFVDSYGGNIQSSLLLFKNNLLTTGVDVFAEFDDTHRSANPEITNNQGIVIKNPPVDRTPPTPKSNRKGVGIFLEDEYYPWSKLTITLGTRFDYIVSDAKATLGTLVEQNRGETDRDFSGNFGALYRLTKNIHIIANIGRAFKAPTLQERYFKGTAQVGYLYGNPNLKSEKSLNLDTGIKWEFGTVSGELNIFRNQINNFIVMKPISVNADTFLYDNVGKAELYGGEFQAVAKLSHQFSIFANSSYTHGQDVKLSEPLPKIPPLAALLGVRYEGMKNNYWLEITGRLVDSQLRVTNNESKTSGYRIFNFGSGINLAKFFQLKYNLFLTFNVKNIFNESYRDHLSSVTWWDAPGRNIIVGLRGSF